MTLEELQAKNPGKSPEWLQAAWAAKHPEEPLQAAAPAQEPGLLEKLKNLATHPAVMTTAGGALGLALTPVTGGASLIPAMIGAGAGSAFGGQMSAALRGDEKTLGGLAFDTAAGAVGPVLGPGMKIAGNALSNYGSRLPWWLAGMGGLKGLAIRGAAPVLGKATSLAGEGVEAVTNGLRGSLSPVASHVPEEIGAHVPNVSRRSAEVPYKMGRETAEYVAPGQVTEQMGSQVDRFMPNAPASFSALENAAPHEIRQLPPSLVDRFMPNVPAASHAVEKGVDDLVRLPPSPVDRFMPNTPGSAAGASGPPPSQAMAGLDSVVDRWMPNAPATSADDLVSNITQTERVPYNIPGVARQAERAQASAARRVGGGAGTNAALNTEREVLEEVARHAPPGQPVKMGGRQGNMHGAQNTGGKHGFTDIPAIGEAELLRLQRAMKLKPVSSH